MALLECETQCLFHGVKGRVKVVGERSTQDPVRLRIAPAQACGAAVSIRIDNSGVILRRKFHNVVVTKVDLQGGHILDLGAFDFVGAGALQELATEFRMVSVS